MTAKAGETFDLRGSVSEVEALVTARVPSAGPTVEEGTSDTGEWTRTRGEGFLIAPLWESVANTGAYGPEWNAAEEAAQQNLTFLVDELDRRWGPHRQVSMRVALFRHLAGEPMPPLHQALCAADCYGDLSVWGPLPPDLADTLCWVAVSLNQSDGDAPMIITAAVSDRPIAELED